MKSILKLLLLLLLLVGCKAKVATQEKQKTKESVKKEVKKDSVFEQKTASKLAVFQVDNSQFFEMDLESEKDSTGESKMLEFERIRSPAGEKIIVRGGKVKIRTASNISEKITKKDTLQVNNTSVRTNIQESKTTESKSVKKEKKVKGGSYLSLSLWILLLIALLFLTWRLKLFRKVTAIITKFKKYLNKV